MKRANGYILGTILVVLIGGVVVLQALNESRSHQDDHQGHDHGQQAAQPPRPAEPTVEDLEQSIAQGEQMQQAPNQGGRIPDSEKFKPVEKFSTDPPPRWWEAPRAQPSGN